MQITICGGGNAAHTLAGLMAAQQEVRVNVYTPFKLKQCIYIKIKPVPGGGTQK
jgi:hypothetical protein